jgi:protein-tyrosine phosphatase
MDDKEFLRLDSERLWWKKLAVMNREELIKNLDNLSIDYLELKTENDNLKDKLINIEDFIEDKYNMSLEDIQELRKILEEGDE